MADTKTRPATVESRVILKQGDVSIPDVTDEDLRKINKYTLRPLTKEEVFVFKIAACDNGLDDRNYEPFNLNALKDLKRLYLGKTVIKDHSRKADNQIARVFDTALIMDENGKTVAHDPEEPFATLELKAYMLRTDSTKDLISEIEAGIKKEVSTGCRPKRAICSICGTDQTKSYCSHFWGREYETKTGKKICYFTLDGAKEAYEVSLVAVPAQPRAGTHKSYMDPELEDPEETTETTDKAAPDQTPETDPADKVKEADARGRLADADAFLMANNK